MKKALQRILSVILLAGFALPNVVFADAEDSWKKEIPKYKAVKADVKKDGPVLLFSDSPEMVKKCGVMYRDTAVGNVRIFFHHVNDTKSPKRLAIVLRNVGIRPVEVTVGRKGVSNPSLDWLGAGKSAQSRYFKGNKEVDFTLKPGEKHEFLTGIKGQIFNPQELITGIVDFNFSRQVEISFMMIPVGTAFSAAVSAYDILPPDIGEYVLRGTFQNADIHVSLSDTFNNEKRDIWGITLADNEEDSYVVGVDATRDKPVVNYGNYGVVYDLAYKTRGDGETILRFNPWGGTFAGVCLLENKDEIVEVNLPNGRVYFGDKRPTENMILAKVAGKMEGKVFFSPPGSSNLPVRIFFAPNKINKKQ
ncbi:MAG: copper amine oxidase [Acidaminococcaceae bacterium]|nr:copper amine oxidase [Acidaminococcaceae bacterium]MDD4722207.1 copper amine oxidase [Acidaminococcaceae bacterium]